MKIFLVTMRPSYGWKDEDICAVLNLVEDWFYYQPGCWLVKTSKKPEWLYHRLYPLTTPTGQLLISEVSRGSMMGWMPEEVWQWLGK
jgi:hypothetical protein